MGRAAVGRVHLPPTAPRLGNGLVPTKTCSPNVCPSRDRPRSRAPSQPRFPTPSLGLLGGGLLLLHAAYATCATLPASPGLQITNASPASGNCVPSCIPPRVFTSRRLISGSPHTPHPMCLSSCTPNGARRPVVGRGLACQTYIRGSAPQSWAFPVACPQVYSNRVLCFCYSFQRFFFLWRSAIVHYQAACAAGNRLFQP